MLMICITDLSEAGTMSGAIDEQSPTRHDRPIEGPRADELVQCLN